MDSKIYDIAIVGSGPAGLMAAINGKVRNKEVLLIGNANLSPKIEKAHRVDNYLGLPKITGKEMQKVFQDQLAEMDIKITEDKVTGIYPNGETFMLMGASTMYQAQSVVIASGIDLNRQIGNEIEMLGMGVSYCATCDAMLYRGKDVAVVATTQEAVHEANYLAEVANKVYFIGKNLDLSHLDSNIEVVDDTARSVEGTDYVTGLKLKNSTLQVDGIFILRDSVKPGLLMQDLEIVDNHIAVDRSMQTNVEGVFACGDVTGKPYQYMKATGEGAIAGLSAVDFINLKKIKK